MKTISRNQSRIQRKRRIRAKVSGSAETPRLAVFRSLAGISAQVIDDSQGKTLVFASLQGIKAKKNDLAGAKEVGKAIAEKCLEKKIKSVVFDRAGYKYHGKVKALAEGAREGGLKF